MGEVKIRLTVYFEEPFWVGVFETEEDGKLSAAKVTFGAEPKNGEVLEFVRNRYYSLAFSPAVDASVRETRKNPKRLQREVNRQLVKQGTGTKSQQALKLQLEQNKTERRVKSREEKRAEAMRMFEQKQQKKKEKHRGR